MKRGESRLGDVADPVERVAADVQDCRTLEGPRQLPVDRQEEVTVHRPATRSPVAWSARQSASAPAAICA